MTKELAMVKNQKEEHSTQSEPQRKGWKKLGGLEGPRHVLWLH